MAEDAISNDRLMVLLNIPNQTHWEALEMAQGHIWDSGRAKKKLRIFVGGIEYIQPIGARIGGARWVDARRQVWMTSSRSLHLY